MAQEQGLDDRIALTAEKIRAGKTSLGIDPFSQISKIQD